MTLAIISLIAALISYFGSKKAGASDTGALVAAGAAGLGTYYVGSQTEWGKSAISSIDQKWAALTGAGGSPELDENGKQIQGPEGATVVRNPDGTPQRDSAGNLIYKLGDKIIDSGGKVLESWGPAGTAGVIGAATLADKFEPWMIWAGVGVIALIALK